MRRIPIFLFLLLAGTATILLLENGCGEDNQNHILAGKFQHIVIIFQENRTPDNLFHDPLLIKAGADIASVGINSKGQSVTLQPAPLATFFDPDHSHQAFTSMYNRGKMNGANEVTIICYIQPCPSSNGTFRYVRPSDVQPYFRMAEQYTFGDRMFQTNQGPSFPAHQFIISGTSAPSANSTSFVAENAQHAPDAGDHTGCTAPAEEFVGVINAHGQETYTFPCTDHPTLTDELNKRGITWKYYTPSSGSLWTAPNAIEHMCGPDSPPPHATACIGADWKEHVILYSPQNPAPILTDIANSQLPVVSWVMPAGKNSDHAGGSYAVPNKGGPSWVASIVNAIGNSQYWANTAIIVTWDDWGGWYDHVRPYKVVNDGVSWGSGYVYGFRVPLIVISPYARPAYISHVNHDFGSILHMVEENFNLPSLGYADSYADDLSDCFNFHQQPLVFKTIDAPLKADYFLNDTAPPTDPDDD